jgi:hypothetical protein
MTPDRMAVLVRRWVRFYTRDLPGPIARRRLEEIDADLHDHIAHERARGIGDRRIVLEIASRLVRGLAADAAWRGRQGKEGMPKTNPLSRSAVRVALGVGIVLSVPLVATLFTDGVAWGPEDFVAAGVLLAVIGIALELAARRAGNLATAAGIAALGVAAAFIGEADDAPGLVLLGLLLIASACALGVRTAQRSR